MLFSLSILNLVIGSSPFGGKSSMTFALVGGRSKSFLERRTVRSISAEPHRHGGSGLDLWLLHQPMIPRSRIVGRGDRAGLLLQESGRETGRVRTPRANQRWVQSGYPEPGRVAETRRVSARYARALHSLIER